MLKRLLAAMRSPRTAVTAVADRADLAADLAASGRDLASWTRDRLNRRLLYASSALERIDQLRRRYPADVTATAQAAERILRHEFTLLGSTFVPVDPDRQPSNGYAPIDWYLDPVRGLRFPRGIPHDKWQLYEMRPANADIKYPWELARCQHWVTLGQAFALTGDERFALEIAHELDDFVEANPPGVGIHWTCAMDIALRVVSWAIALELVHASATLDHAFWSRAYSALYEHAGFIRGHLENTFEVTSNHFLSDVVGLLYAGAVFADLQRGEEWTAFARASIEQEIDVQVLSDGADFESSVPYHRLVTELFLGSARLSDYQGTSLTARYRSRLRDMVAYLAAVTRPDGLLPQIGDADDGRLHVMSGYGTRSPQDGRHLFGPAAAMFDEPAWASLGTDASAWECEWWGLTPAAPSPASGVSSRLFPNAGIAVMRSERSYLVATNSIVGTKGFGNHKHNDQLSFECHVDGIPLIVDPGTFVYTSDASARNRFRGTAVHNTLRIDDVEQNEINPEWLFRMFESSHAEHVSFDDRADAVEYVGRHHGYERLAAPVTHERRFRLDKQTGAMTIEDRLTGAGRHQLRWHFHLAPDVEAARAGARGLELSAGGRRWTFCVPEDVDVAIVPGEYSPSYGVKQPCSAIECGLTTALDGQRAFRFAIEPS